MLLGIVLHSALAFMPGAWLVADSRADYELLIDEIQHAIHGFRMPLFFLISGFFTTMLWRRRGVVALARHRALRVLLPLIVGLFTILPLMDVVGERAADAAGGGADLLGAIVAGNAERVEGLARAGEPINTPDDDGTTPLHVAAYLGRSDVIDVLIEYGANLNAVEASGATPAASAVASGQAAAADQLIAAGAFDFRSPGQEWSDLDFWRIAPFDDDGGADDAVLGIDSLDHLWFLWFLVILVAGFVVVAAVLDRLPPLPALTDRRVVVIMWAMIPLSAVAHNVMADERGLLFGPATSTSVRPDWVIIAYYATFFAFGALLWGRTDRGGRPMVRVVGRGWPITLGLGLVIALPVGLALYDNDDANVTLAVAVQVAYTWLMIFGLMGLFHRVLGTERAAVRYLSDSSYWLYVAHLPLVIFLQVEIADWNIPAEIKFVGLIAVSTVLLLISYALFVRSTPIGQLLNGRRHPFRLRP